MNESGHRSGYLAWFVIIWAATFVLVLGLLLVQNETLPLGTLIGATLGSSAAFSAMLVVGVFSIRWLCNWRNFRRFLFGVACVVTLLALALAFENWRGKHAWEKHRAYWEARGDKFNIAALAPPAVPDERNLAMAPLLKPMLDFSEQGGRAIWRDTNALARLSGLSATLEPSRKTNNTLALGNLEKGTFADLTAMGEFYRGNTNYPQPAPGASSAEQILIALAKFDPDFHELSEAAAARPLSRFPIQYDLEPAWAILLPHLSYLRGMVNYLNVRAVAELEARNPAAAFSDLKLALRLTDGIAEEPLLVDHLVRIANLALCLQTVREGLMRHAWSDTELRELQINLGTTDILSEFDRAMRGELAVEITGLNFLRREGFRQNPMMYLAADGGAAQSPAYNLMPSGWYYQNMLTLSRMFHDYLLLTVDARMRQVSPDLSDKGNQALTNLVAHIGPYNIFARLLLPTLDRAVRKSGRALTFVDEARVACAIERYRLANGRLPGTLTELVPGLLEKMPNDVIDGQPLRYRVQPDGGYVLYSVGWNKTDDGGQSAFASDTKASSVDLTKGDWVWKMPGAK